MMRGLITRKFDTGPIPFLCRVDDFRKSLKLASVEELEVLCKKFKL